MTTIERLDYSEPPCGYDVCDDGDDEETAASIAAAWREYKATHNPPGMWVGFAGILPDCAEAWTRIGIRTPFAQIELRASRKVVLTDDGSEWKAAALEDAWTHYDRSLAIAAKVDDGAVVLAAVHGDTRIADIQPWPHCLGWWDEACDDVDAYVDRMEGFTDKVPDVLMWCMEVNKR